MVLIGLWLLPLGRIDGVPAVDTAVAATFATALISTSFTSQAILTGFDRRNGVLRWVATSPLGRGGYLAGKILRSEERRVGKEGGSRRGRGREKDERTE